MARLLLTLVLACTGLAAVPASAQDGRYRGYGWSERFIEVEPGPGGRLPPRIVGRIVNRNGMVRVDRIRLAGDAYVIDGLDRSGRRLRLVMDAYDGVVLDRAVALTPVERPAPRRAPAIVRSPVPVEPRPPRATPKNPTPVAVRAEPAPSPVARVPPPGAGIMPVAPLDDALARRRATPAVPPALLE